MRHRAKKHPSKKVCRYFKEDKCLFSSKECAYSHEERSEEEREMESEFPSVNCDQKFKKKNEFMQHRKGEHKDRTRECRDHRENRCEYTPENCWFIHEDNHEEKKFNQSCKFGKRCRNLGKSGDEKCKYKHEEKDFQKTKSRKRKTKKKIQKIQ